MEERKNWLRENWRIGVLLVLILGLAMFLRTYFVYSEFAPAGFWTGGGDYSGGSDPFYWERALLYSFQTGKEISWDYAMNYPIGFPDVRPPLFDWFNLLAGYLATPFFGGSSWNGMVWMLNMNAAIFGVLAIIPTYLIGKEAFNKRAGILAALLLAISAAALSRSHATIAVHDSWTLFFVICAFYFYLRALKTLNRRRWVENWFQRASAVAGIRGFFRENRKSVLYAFLAGLSVGVTALSWQGWAYVPVILVLIYVVEIMLDRIRNQDAMGVTILFMIILAVPLFISLPWYAVRNLIHVWWDVPFYLFIVAAILGIVFTVTRDYPWTIIIPATLVAGAAGLAIGFTVNPALLYAFYSGAGYFVKNKVYTTIAEAQEPGMSELILSFGMFTFGIGLAAVGYMLWQTPRRNNPAYTMLVLWTFGALFMALSAARFIFNAAPVMAIATGYALDLILARMGFEEMRRTYRSLSEGSWRNAVRKSVKPRHVLVVTLLILLILLPNVWFAVDSGIPYEQKATYDKQIESVLPSFLQAPGYASVGSGNTFYLGAFGYSLPKSTDYFPAAYAWLDQQDTNVPLVDRPAVLAWWDYGFEIAERGGHPVVADPFQNGYGISGQFILAQNESTAIALMTLRLVEGDYHAHSPGLSPALAATLTAYGIDPNLVLYAFKNPTALNSIILNDPNTYGLWSSSLQTVNTPYIFLTAVLLERLSENQLVNLYASVSGATGTYIGYFMVDTRLFPLSASNTGIFYAPAELSDHRVISLASGQVLPVDFFSIYANTTNANNLPIQFVPAAAQITAETMQYLPMFYNSMFYRAFVGYSPSVVGSQDKGAPGLDQALSSLAPIPAWNMTHFRVVYRTAYYNPFKDPSNHTSAWQAINYDTAQAYQQQITAGKRVGVVDMSTTTDIQNGAVILRYYPGAYVNGTVSVNGVPLPHVMVTVTDELGTPHGVTTTDANGHYSLLAPFGNITVTASTGAINNLTQVGTAVLTSTTFHVTEDQAMRVNADPDGDGIVDWLITKNLAVPAASIHGKVYIDLNRNGQYDTADLALAGATVQVTSTTSGFTENATADPAGTFTVSNLPSGTYAVRVTTHGHTEDVSGITISAGTNTDNLAVPFQSVHGRIVDANGTLTSGATVTLADALNGTSWQTATNATGNFTFSPVLAGKYTLTASLGQEASIPFAVDVTTAAVLQNLSLAPAGRVTGSTVLFGTQPLPYATILFQNTATNYLVETVTSDAAAHYSVSLPTGDWNVFGRFYQGTNLYATLGQVAVQQGQNETYAANFVDGARVSGNVAAEGQTGDLRALIGFLGASGEQWVRSALGNTYVAFLPQGTYSLVASTTGAAYTGTITLTGQATRNLYLTNATLVTGRAYWDMNRDGVMEPGEAIAGARIALSDNTGGLTVAYTNTTGVFQVTLFGNRTYAGEITADGFLPYTITATTVSAMGPDTRYAMTALPVDLTGTVYVNGTVLLNHPLALQAVAIGGGAVSENGTTLSDGTFSLSLRPGTYLLQVDENVTPGNPTWRYQNLGTETVGLPLGWGQIYYPLAVAARARVQGNVTLSGVAGPATVTFTGPDNKSVSTTSAGYTVYLQAGTYSVRADRTVGSTQYAVLKNVTVPLVGNLTLALGPAAQVSGAVTFGGLLLPKAVPITFVRQEGGSFQALSSATGAYSVYLVPGNYTVSVDNASSQLVNGITRYYLYTFQGDLTVPPAILGVSYNVATSRSDDNTTVQGSVLLNGGGVDASLSFIAESGGAVNATTASAADGSYSVPLAPGTYVVYATRAVGPYAYLATLKVAHAAAQAYTFTLEPAYTMAGVTTNPAGSPVPALLNITGLATLTLTTAGDGSYSVILPAGDYGLVADRTQVEQGLPITYEGSTSVTLSADALVNLHLGRLDKHAVGVTWNPDQNRTISPGGSVTYTIVVQNQGNVADTFNLSGSATGWTFAFNPTSVNLNYGDAPNATAVQVTIQAPANALVNHAPLTILATSAADNTAAGSLVVNVGITRVRGLTLQVNGLTGTFDGTYLNYSVNVRNTGNAPETVDVSLQNPSDVAAAGWTAGLAQTGSSAAPTATLSGVSVDANTTVTLRLVLRASGETGGTTVALQAAATDNPAVQAQTLFTATLPQLSAPSGVGITGTGIALTLPPNELLIAAIVGAVAAVAVGLFLTRRGR